MNTNEAIIPRNDKEKPKTPKSPTSETSQKTNSAVMKIADKCCKSKPKTSPEEQNELLQKVKVLLVKFEQDLSAQNLYKTKKALQIAKEAGCDVADLEAKFTPLKTKALIQNAQEIIENFKEELNNEKNELPLDWLLLLMQELIQRAEKISKNSDDIDQIKKEFTGLIKDQLIPKAKHETNTFKDPRYYTIENLRKARMFIEIAERAIKKAKNLGCDVSDLEEKMDILRLQFTQSNFYVC